MKIISSVIEAVIVALNVFISVYVAVIFLFISGFTTGAPRRNMTDADWAIYALGHFFNSLGPALILASIAFFMNFLLFSLVPRNAKSFRQILNLRGSSDKLELKRVLLWAGILAGVIAAIAISASFYGAFSIYLSKPPHFD